MKGTAVDKPIDDDAPVDNPNGNPPDEEGVPPDEQPDDKPDEDELPDDVDPVRVDAQTQSAINPQMGVNS